MRRGAIAAALRRRVRATGAVWRRGDRHLRMLPEVCDPSLPEARDPSLRELPHGCFDVPNGARPVPRGFVHVQGWAIASSGPPDRIELTLDGAPAGRARLCLPRPDLPPHVGPYGAIAGFEHRLDFSVLPPRTRTTVLGGRAFSRDGSSYELEPVRLTVAPAPAAGGHRDVERLEQLRARCARVAASACAADRREGASDRPLRLLVVTHHLGYGGAQLVLAELLERWAAADGVTGTVVAPDDGATRQQIERAGFDVHIAGALPLGDVETYEGRIAELAAWAAPQGFDAVLVNTACAFTGGDLAARLGLPAVWIVHESYGLAAFFATYGDALHPYVRERAEAAFRDAAAIVFEVDATRRLFEAEAGAAPTLTIPYGIDVAALDGWAGEWDRARARAALGLPQHDAVVMCVGTLEPRKGQTQLVEAFARVAPSVPGATLVLVGDRGDGGATPVRDAVVLNWVRERVRILPVLPDVRPCYLAADVLVCASDVESLPRSVLEAMALRVPVVATDVFGLPEVVREDETGWLCESRDTAVLAAALERALHTPPARRRELAEAARALVRAEHEVSACAPRYAAVIAAAVRGEAIAPTTAALPR